MKRIIPFILVFSAIFFLSSSLAQTAVYELDKTGDATLTVSEEVFAELEEIDTTISTRGSTIDIAATLKDLTLSSVPDIRADFSASGDTAVLNAVASGPQIALALATFGDFAFEFTMTERGGDLMVTIDASFDAEGMEYVLGIPPEDILAVTEEDLEAVELALNEEFAATPIRPVPQLTIDEFEVGGEETISVFLSFSLLGWADYNAQLAAEIAAEDANFTSGLDCLGINPEDLVSAMLRAESTTTLTITPDGDELLIGSTSTSNTASEDIISSIDMRILKQDDILTIDAEAELSDKARVLSCILSDFSAQGTVSDIELTISGGYSAVQTLSAEISSFAQKSDEAYVARIPSEITADFDVTVNLPQDMAPTSVSGGTHSDSSVLATRGEELIVEYGKQTSIDMTFILVGAAILILIVLLAKKRK